MILKKRIRKWGEKMKIGESGVRDVNQEICIERLGSVFEINIDGCQIKNVSNYKIASSANGITELELKLTFKGELAKFEMSASPESQSS